MKIMITGGHPAPAIALIDDIRSSTKYNKTDIVFVGRKYNNEREKTLSYEYKEITDRKIPFIHLTTGRLTRIASLRTLKSMALVPVGLVNAFSILMSQKPDAVMSFGGYLAMPIAIAANMMGIPVYTHEQAIEPGMASKIIAKFAKTVFVSFPGSKVFFDPSKVVITGNIVRKAVFFVDKKPFTVPKGKPVIYVTGGSLGSHSVNVHIEDMLGKLLAYYTVIHQTGNVEEYNDFKRLSEVKQNLSPQLRERYIVMEHVSAHEIGYIYSVADMVIGRSGANTVFELIALKKPSILIPLPWSAHDEQLKQARLLEKAGVAKVFLQDGTSDELYAAITDMMNNISSYSSNFTSLSNLYSRNASELVMETIFKS